MRPAAYRLDHLDRLCDERGIHEHAEGARARPEHGYCTDDNARLLIVASREPAGAVADRLSWLALEATLAAQDPQGRFHNRMAPTGARSWLDDPSTGDWWGRAVWGLGVAAALHDDPALRERACVAAVRGSRQRSPWLRSMAFAALGAGELLLAGNSDPRLSNLIGDFLRMVDALHPRVDWPWPEDMLTYANASVAEAILVAGLATGRPSAVRSGLRLTSWLVAQQTLDGHISAVGSAGRGPSEHGPQFDQQPIEVAALADACWRAWVTTGDAAWLGHLERCAAWFHGANDVSQAMFSPHTWGGFDGLTPTGPNTNQGAESTMAFVSTMQRVRPFTTMVPAVQEHLLGSHPGE